MGNLHYHCCFAGTLFANLYTPHIVTYSRHVTENSDIYLSYRSPLIKGIGKESGLMLFKLQKIFPVQIHPSIIYSAYLLRIVGKLEPERRGTPRVRGLSNKGQTAIHTPGQFTVATWPNLHVSGALGRNPHRQHTNSAQKGKVKLRTFLQRDDNANCCATMAPSLLKSKMQKNILSNLRCLLEHSLYQPSGSEKIERKEDVVIRRQRWPGGPHSSCPVPPTPLKRIACLCGIPAQSNLYLKS